MTYTDDERARAAAWKRTTTTLPDEARLPAAYVRKDGAAAGPAYDFCLPADHADLNLLPEVREGALALFAELGVPWHASVAGGPSNHLLSSQVQCVNALGQMVTDPGRVVRAFASVVDVGEVLQVEPGRYLTFEFIGPHDVFGESPGRPRVRGSGCTSVDAAFLHRAGDGVVELVLVEWKYTETYSLRRPDPGRDEVRRARYEQAVQDPAGPIDPTILPFGLLLDEPLYQLVRQQLLAHALDNGHVLGAGRVRVVHVDDPRNTGYQRLHRAEHLTVGATVEEVWARLLRHPERFTRLPSATFLDPAVTSAEYVARYGPHDPQDRTTMTTSSTTTSGTADYSPTMTRGAAA